MDNLPPPPPQFLALTLLLGSEVNKRKTRICFDFDQAEAIFGIGSVTCTTNIKTEGEPQQWMAAKNTKRENSTGKMEVREHSTWRRGLTRKSGVEGQWWGQCRKMPRGVAGVWLLKHPQIIPGLSHQDLCARVPGDTFCPKDNTCTSSLSKGRWRFNRGVFTEIYSKLGS